MYLLINILSHFFFSQNIVIQHETYVSFFAQQDDCTQKGKH